MASASEWRWLSERLEYLRGEYDDPATCQRLGLDPSIAVDGGITTENVSQVVDAGANAIVAGSAVFGSPDYAAAIVDLRRYARPADELR